MSESSNEDGASCSCSCSCMLQLFAWSVVLGVGIFLILFGSYELETCELSMLPMYILVTGCSLVAGCALRLLAAIILLLSCPYQDTSNLLYRQCRFILVILFVVFYTIWWLAGCYWTWALGSVNCVPRVLKVALFTTIAPVACVLAFCCTICNSKTFRTYLKI